MFTDALTYPVRSSGWIVILIGAVFSAVLDFLQLAPLLGSVIGIFGAGYFGAFYLDIVNSTMTGRDDIPDWPSFGSFLDNILSPFLRLLGLTLFSFAPLLVVLIFARPNASWVLPALGAALLYAGCYFPMAVLAAQAFGSVFSALPHVVLPAIWRAMPGYLLAVLALVLGFVVCGAAQVIGGKVPYLGWFLTATFALYGLMFQARLIGLIYRAKADQLAW